MDLTVKKLSEMRQYADEMDMPPLQRRAVTQAIASLERQWRGQHTERHTEGKKSRNAHSRKVRETSAEIVSSAKALW
jgi:hypothetical protein